MATALTIIKRGYYRGDPTEEWSNKYRLTGTDPADDAAWRTLFDAFVAQEKTLYTAATNVVRGYGYTDDADNADSVWGVDLTLAPNTIVPGTFSAASSRPLPGDAAVWIRWATNRKSRGKTIYLRKYFHDVLIPSTGSNATADNVLPAWTTAAGAFGTLIGTGAGISGRKIRDKGGGTILSSQSSSYFTTRTLKRRGKRPPTS